MQVVTSLPGAWSHVSPGKAVLPPVYKMMASGGAGLAPHTFSNLMPFLSQVPASVLTAEDSKVAERWLLSLQTGLNTLLEANKTRRDELKAVTSAYLECVMLILNMEVIDHDFKVKVLDVNDNSPVFSHSVEFQGQVYTPVLRVDVEENNQVSFPRLIQYAF